MLGLVKGEDEDMATFMTRVNSKLKHFRQLFQRDTWDAVYHRRQFRWAGHVARFKTYDPDRLTFKILHFRNWAYLQNIAVQNNGRQLHGRRLRTWRWERPLYKYFSTSPEEWEDKAQDKRWWAQHLEMLVAWRLKNR